MEPSSSPALPSICERCGSSMNFFMMNLEQAVLLCSDQNVRCGPFALFLPRIALCHPSHHVDMRVTDLCVSVCLCPQCLWPLGDIDDLDAVCLPVSDPRVRRWRQSALSGSLHADAQMTGNDGNSGATAMSASSLQLGGLSHSANSPSAAAALPTVARDPSAESDPDLELQRISNMLLQPSPACSPALAATAWLPRLPTGDSLPPSASLGDWWHQSCTCRYLGGV